MKIKSPLLNRIICEIAVWSLRALYKTTRIEIRLTDPVHDPYEPNRTEECVYSVWHDSLLYPLFMNRPRSIVGLVGPHRDGDYVSNVLKALKLKAVRGSSSRGGATAIVKSMEEIKDHSLVITPDGPRGPRREMKLGCAFVAAQSGTPVIATAFSCSNAWSLQGSWTDLIVPKPFSRVYAVTGEPIYVPKDATREMIEEVTQQIQAEMDRLDKIAVALANGEDLPKQDVQTEAPKRSAA